MARHGWTLLAQCCWWGVVFPEKAFQHSGNLTLQWKLSTEVSCPLSTKLESLSLSYIRTYHLHFQVDFWIMKQDWIVSWFSQIYVDGYSFVHYAAPQQTSVKGVLWGVPTWVTALVNMSRLHKRLLNSLLPAFLSQNEVCPHIEGR